MDTRQPNDVEHKRLFLAIPLPGWVQEILVTYGKRALGEGIRWVPPAHLHVTLLFLGHVPQPEYEAMLATLQSASLPAAFWLEGNGIRVIHRKRRLAMIWASFYPSPHFTNLVTCLARVLHREPDHAPNPHVTLARTVRNYQGAGPVDWPKLDPIQLPIDHFAWWESNLLPGGAQYNALHQFWLPTG